MNEVIVLAPALARLDDGFRAIGEDCKNRRAHVVYALAPAPAEVVAPAALTAPAHVASVRFFRQVLS